MLNSSYLVIQYFKTSSFFGQCLLSGNIPMTSPDFEVKIVNVNDGQGRSMRETIRLLKPSMNKKYIQLYFLSSNGQDGLKMVKTPKYPSLLNNCVKGEVSRRIRDN